MNLLSYDCQRINGLGLVKFFVNSCKVVLDYFVAACRESRELILCHCLPLFTLGYRILKFFWLLFRVLLLVLLPLALPDTTSCTYYFRLHFMFMLLLPDALPDTASGYTSGSTSGYTSGCNSGYHFQVKRVLLCASYAKKSVRRGPFIFTELGHRGAQFWKVKDYHLSSPKKIVVKNIFYCFITFLCPYVIAFDG